MLEVSKKDAKEETINEASALWTRAPKDIKEKQYEDFFSHIGAGFGKPLLTMHNNTEGTVSYTNYFVFLHQNHLICLILIENQV